MKGFSRRQRRKSSDPKQNDSELQIARREMIKVIAGVMGGLVAGGVIGAASEVGDRVRSGIPGADEVLVKFTPSLHETESGTNMSLSVMISPLRWGVGRVPEGELILRHPGFILVNDKDRHVPRSAGPVTLGPFVFRSSRHSDELKKIQAVFQTGTKKFSDSLDVRIGPPSALREPTNENLTGRWKLLVGRDAGTLVLLQNGLEVKGSFSLGNQRSGDVTGSFDTAPNLIFDYHDDMNSTEHETIRLEGAIDVISKRVVTFCGPAVHEQMRDGKVVGRPVRVLFSAILPDPVPADMADAEVRARIDRCTPKEVVERTGAPTPG